MRLTVPPFAKAADDAVRFVTAWHDVRGKHAELLGDHIENWDYLTVLTLRCDLEVDVAAVRRDAHLGSKVKLMVMVSAKSSSTRLRGPVWTAPLTSKTTQRLKIDFELAGGELGGRLDLVTHVVVSDPDPVDELGAGLRGAIIWESRHTVMLEGAAAQFPTEAADLSAAPWNLPRAAWLLEIVNDDLDAAAAGAVRLIVNETHEVMKMVLDGDVSAEAVRAVDSMRWDVARRLMEIALSSPEFAERDAFEADSFGWLLAAVVETHFPGWTKRTLRDFREAERSKYEAAVQDAARIFG